MNLVWIANARRAFAAVYGERRGLDVCNAVIPGVMADFRKMLAKADDGALVREDYRTDDRRTGVHLEGRRTGDEYILTRLEVGGVPVDLGAAELTL